MGLALRGKQELGLTQYQIALMFSECSLVMFVVQAVVFSPWIKPETTRWLVAPALAVLAAALAMVPRASDFPLMLTVVGTVAASAGILSPILTYWVSSRAGATQGAALGKQTAATSLGAAVGSAAGGLLFDVAPFADASFLLVSGLTAIGFVISFGLPNLLVSRRLGMPPQDRKIEKATSVVALIAVVGLTGAASRMGTERAMSNPFDQISDRTDNVALTVAIILPAGQARQSNLP